MTFTDFKQMQPTATAQSKSVLDYTVLLCEVLRTNYQSSAIQRHRDSIEKGELVEYHRKEIDKLCEGEGIAAFEINKGRKYYKIVMKERSGNGSVHCFVDMNSGAVYKPASFNSPAKGIRYYLLDDTSRETLLRRAEYSGGYLYK